MLWRGVVLSSSVLFSHAFPGSCLSLGPSTWCKRSLWSLPRHVPSHFQTGIVPYSAHILVTGMICFTNLQDKYRYTLLIDTLFCLFFKSLFMFCIPPLTHSRTLGPTLSIWIRSFSKCQAKKNRKSN